MAIVYLHYRNDTGKVFYVGIGKTDKRAYESRRRSKYWMNVLNKYGLTVDIIHTDISWEEACEIEKYLIAFYGRKDLKLGTLSNVTDGGNGTFNPSDETKLKMSAGAKRAWKENASFIESQNKRIANFLSKPETIKMLSEISKRSWSKPEFRQLQLEKIKNQWGSTNLRERVMAGRKKAWSDPVYIEKMKTATSKRMLEKSHNAQKVIEVATGNIFRSKRHYKLTKKVGQKTVELLLKEGKTIKYYQP